MGVSLNKSTPLITCVSEALKLPHGHRWYPADASCRMVMVDATFDQWEEFWCALPPFCQENDDVLIIT